MPFILFIATSR